MSPRPKGGASWPLQAKRLTSETGNVHCGVEVSIMNRAAFAADPLPDPKTFSTFWASEASALGTGLGCVSLVHFGESNPCVIAFVFKEVAQHRPAHVERGFRLA